MHAHQTCSNMPPPSLLAVTMLATTISPPQTPTLHPPAPGHCAADWVPPWCLAHLLCCLLGALLSCICTKNIPHLPAPARCAAARLPSWHWLPPPVLPFGLCRAPFQPSLCPPYALPETPGAAPLSAAAPRLLQTQPAHEDSVWEHSVLSMSGFPGAGFPWVAYVSNTNRAKQRVLQYGTSSP
eukprot:scaffold60644_cov17-Tisochrysis_lutea.AAC.1